jgi:hypothetical protein
MSNERESPLYEDHQLKIEMSDFGPLDQVIYFKEKGELEESQYLIQRGILQDFARFSRPRFYDAVRNFNEPMVVDAEERGIGLDGLCAAFSKAYIENERRIEIAVAQMRSEMGDE